MDRDGLVVLTIIMSILAVTFNSISLGIKIGKEEMKKEMGIVGYVTESGDIIKGE